jgi:hypothetical protein
MRISLVAFAATACLSGADTITATNAAARDRAPTRLSMMLQPSTKAQPGVAFSQQPIIQLRDASDFPVNQAGIVVTAAIGTGDGILNGTLSATTDASGVAGFQDLSIDGSEGIRTLSFSAPGLAPVTSGNVNVSTVVPIDTTISAQPGVNIVNNASFEGSWNGFTNWGGGLPTGDGLSLDSTLAYDGSWSIRRSWSPNPLSDVGAQLAYNFGNTDRVWVRFYFRLTAPITSIMKFMRFYAPGFGQPLGGLYLGQGGDIFTFGTDQENSTITTSIGLREAQVIDGNWHSLQVEFWRNGDPSGSPTAAFWFDGQPQSLPDGTPVHYACGQTSPGATCSGAYWQGGRLFAGTRSASGPIAVMEWLATLNAGNTTTGQINIDKISISTKGRIVP